MHSFIYSEEKEILNYILKDAIKYYKKCKRNKIEFIPNDVSKKINYFNSYEDVYLEICRRVKEHPYSTKIND